MISEIRKLCLQAEVKSYCEDQMEYVDEYFIAELYEVKITVEELEYIKTLKCGVIVREE